MFITTLNKSRFQSICFCLFFLAMHWQQQAISQEALSKEFSVRSGAPIHLEFDEANLITVSGWSENKVSIQAKININDNQQNKAYRLKLEQEAKYDKIIGQIDQKDDLPEMIRIKKGDEIFLFQTDQWNDPIITKFIKEHGEEGIEWRSKGVIWEIFIDVKIPMDATCSIDSKHGLIELSGITGKLTASSTHGGIDLSIGENMDGTLQAKTRWGNIYSNLDLEIDEDQSSDREWNHVIAKIKGGRAKSSYQLESRHANIYLRNQ